LLCQICHKRPATKYIKQISNGVTKELYVCSSCGGQHPLSYVSHAVNVDFFNEAGRSDILDQPCKTCGMQYADILKAGKVGCPDCYIHFRQSLLPSIKRIHGNDTHVGKRGTPSVMVLSNDDRLKELKEKLSDALLKEDYEQCAVLRDKIKAFEQGGEAG